MNYSYDRFYKLFEITFSGGWDGPWNYGKG